MIACLHLLTMKERMTSTVPKQAKMANVSGAVIGTMEEHQNNKWISSNKYLTLYLKLKNEKNMRTLTKPGWLI